MTPSVPPHTLLLMQKSSEFTSNLMALLDSAGSRTARKAAAQAGTRQCRGRQRETRRAAGVLDQSQSPRSGKFHNADLAFTDYFNR